MYSGTEDLEVCEQKGTAKKECLNLPDDIPTLKKIIAQKDNNLNASFILLTL